MLIRGKVFLNAVEKSLHTFFFFPFLVIFEINELVEGPWDHS